EHRRLVLLALADHDPPFHGHGIEHGAHGVDGSLVGRVLVAAPDPAPGRHRRSFGHAHELEREVAIRPLPRHGSGPYIRSGASTPIRSSERAITCCVARTRASRNGSSSEPTTRRSW